MPKGLINVNDFQKAKINYVASFPSNNGILVACKS